MHHRRDRQPNSICWPAVSDRADQKVDPRSRTKWDRHRVADTLHDGQSATCWLAQRTTRGSAHKIRRSPHAGACFLSHCLDPCRKASLQVLPPRPLPIAPQARVGAPSAVVPPHRNVLRGVIVKAAEALTIAWPTRLPFSNRSQTCRRSKRSLTVFRLPSV